MENKRKYQIDFYRVKICERLCEISVQYFTEEAFFFCKFINDKYSDFINSYNSFGFYVDKTGEVTKFIVNGKFTETEALNIWGQIELEQKPTGSTFIILK